MVQFNFCIKFNFFVGVTAEVGFPGLAYGQRNLLPRWETIFGRGRKDLRKILQMAVMEKLQPFLDEDKYLEYFQSMFGIEYSTETTLVTVTCRELGIPQLPPRLWYRSPEHRPYLFIHPF